MSSVAKTLLLRRLLKLEDLVRTHIEDFWTPEDSMEPRPEAGLLIEADGIITELIRAVK